jgi:hypothetical protein
MVTGPHWKLMSLRTPDCWNLTAEDLVHPLQVLGHQIGVCADSVRIFSIDAKKKFQVVPHLEIGAPERDDLLGRRPDVVKVSEHHHFSCVLFCRPELLANSVRHFGCLGLRPSVSR